MNDYQNIKACLLYLKMLEENKLFLTIFHMELVTGQRPFILNENPSLDLKYQYFKYRYLKELATSKSLYMMLDYNANRLERVNYELSANYA